MATNLPLFPRRLQFPFLVTVRSVRVRLSRTIQGPKSQPESCFGRMCLNPENDEIGNVGFSTGLTLKGDPRVTPAHSSARPVSGCLSIASVYAGFWWAVKDSNLRPPACKAGALTN